MPLIDLRTNLKSLKYGMDQPGGGSSGLPYIQTYLPPSNLIVANPDTLGGAGNTNPIIRINSTGNLDYPIRGGNVKFNIGTQTFTLSSQIDKERIKKFMKDPSRGTLFIKKQIGLQLSNPKIETGNSFQASSANQILPGLIENTRIYNNGLNTIDQVGVQGTGVHLPRAGVFPYNPNAKYYKDIVGAQSLLNQDQVLDVNRLLILQQLKLSTTPAKAIVNINQVNKLGISLNRNILFNYLGGPGSTYGIGATVIKRSLAADTSRAAINKINSTVSMTYDNIMAQSLNQVSNGKKSKKIQDYRTGKQIDTREDIYNLTVYGKGDKMNLMSSFMFDNSQAPWEVTDPMATGTKDIIKFVFEAIENNSSTQSWAIFFRAMLQGFSDNHQASINSFKYLGRGEDFYTYQGISRVIGFSFKIAVQSKDELKPLYTKLNHLISQVYPDYSSNFGIMRAPMIRLTIGDYLYRVAGMLENVSITIDDNAPWEINYENSKDTKQLPQVINVQCSFKPIQDFLPRRENNENFAVPFIGNQEDKDYLDISGGFRFDKNTRNTLNSTALAAQSKTVSEEEANMFPTEDLSGTIPPTTSPLKYSPKEKTKLFESTLEKERRTGDLFRLRQYQVDNSMFTSNLQG